MAKARTGTIEWDEGNILFSTQNALMVLYLQLKTKIHSRSLIVNHTFDDRFGMSDANDTIKFFINSLDTLNSSLWNWFN